MHSTNATERRYEQNDDPWQSAVLGVGVWSGVGSVSAQSKGVQVTVKEADRRVDVTVDGQPFTSYVWPTTLKKPVLYPIRTAKGTLVTRGFPLDPRRGERVDHPHHVGLWFNYGDVNGIDFWNNSDAIRAGAARRRWAPSSTRRSRPRRAGRAKACSRSTPTG